MANTKKPEEKEALATTRSLDDQIGYSLEARPETIAEGGVVVLMVTPAPAQAQKYEFKVGAGTVRVPDGELPYQAYWDTDGLRPSSYEAKVTITMSSSSSQYTCEAKTAKTRITVVPRQVQASVTLQRSGAVSTKDQALWVAIRNRTQAISFNRYHEFIDRVLCEGNPTKDSKDYGSPSFTQRRVDLEGRATIHGMDAYSLLKLATEAFLIFECGLVKFDDELFDAEAESRRLGQPATLDSIRTQLASYLTGDKVLPYLDRIVTQIVGISQGRREERLPYCEAILQNRLTCPSLLELIWSYWHEEGMLAQTLNAIVLRFQNQRRHARDPLANLELDPLRPLNNLLWGFIQDEYSRLSVQRRAYEYDRPSLRIYSCR